MAIMDMKSGKMNQYKTETELKARLRCAGLSVKVPASWLGKPPSTVANWLNGWAPMPAEYRVIIESRLAEIERSQGEQVGIHTNTMQGVRQ
jgi:hypothetical protein